MYRGILAALGLINFGFGILAAIQPELVASWIGFELTGPSALGEMRAVFGGAVCVVGVLFIVAMVVSRPAMLLGGLALVFAALSAGRLASLLIDGWSFYTVLALMFEAATAGVTAMLWRNPGLLEPEQDLESALAAAADGTGPGSEPARSSGDPPGGDGPEADVEA